VLVGTVSNRIITAAVTSTLPVELNGPDILPGCMAETGFLSYPLNAYQPALALLSHITNQIQTYYAALQTKFKPA